MENWREIEARINRNNAEIKKLDEAVKAAKWSERNAPEIVKAAERAELLRVENAILTDNARRAFVMELLPVALEEIAKYSGKPAGDKTREKIYSAFHARTGHKFYISRNSYTTILTFVCLNAQGYSGTGLFRYNETNAETVWTGGTSKTVLTAENKIDAAALALDNWTIHSCREYDEEPRKSARAIIKANAKINEQRAQYERACSEYNSLIPSHMKEASPREGGKIYLF